MADLRGLIRQLAREFDSEGHSAHDLWSWLPSHDAAKRHYGDYACDRERTLADLLREAAMVFSALAGYDHTADEIVDWFYCDTDSLEEPPTDSEKLAHVRAWFEERGWNLKVR